MSGNNIIAAIVLWPLLAAIAWLMWRHMRGQSFSDWLKRDARKHHAVQDMLREHPRGGDHAQVTKWLGEHKQPTIEATHSE